MFVHDIYADYYHEVLPRMATCEIDQLENSRNQLKWWLHCASFKLTGYPNALLMPFAPAVLPLVFYLGYYITKDEKIGLLSLGAMVVNPYYHNWLTTGTYDQVWSFFLLLSVVLLFKNTKVSFGSYLIAVFAKSLALLYLPLWIYTMWKTTKDRSMFIIPILLFCLFALVIIQTDNTTRLVGNTVGFYPENIEQAAIRNIELFWPIIPALLGLLAWNNAFRADNPPKNKRLVALWIITIFAMTPIIHIFTQQLTFGYRYFVLSAFVSVLVAMVIKETWQFRQEAQTRIKIRLGMTSL